MGKTRGLSIIDSRGFRRSADLIRALTLYLRSEQFPHAPLNNERLPMSMIEPSADAPDFELDSHQDQTVKGSSFKGTKNVLLVFYPLDFTPT